MTCEFDNYKIWDLSEVDFPESVVSPTQTELPAWVTDFSEPILAAIQDHEPYFQDDFGTNTKGWS